MARGAEKQSKDTFNQAKDVRGQGSGLFSTSQANANGIFSPLLETYRQEATNPQGIGAPGLAAENTASQQSNGGAVAGAVGEGNLMAARTRNKGGFQIANNAAAMEAGRRNSQNAVENIARNEQLKEMQRQSGIAGQAGLYGEQNRTALGALGAENQSLGAQTGATNALTEAGKSGWLQNGLAIINALKPGYSGSGGFSLGGRG